MTWRRRSSTSARPPAEPWSGSIPPIQARHARIVGTWTRRAERKACSDARSAGMRNRRTSMRPRSSGTDTSPHHRRRGRPQSTGQGGSDRNLLQMDGVPQVNRRRSLWIRHLRPSPRVESKAVDTVRAAGITVLHSISIFFRTPFPWNRSCRSPENRRHAAPEAPPAPARGRRRS